MPKQVKKLLMIGLLLSIILSLLACIEKTENANNTATVNDGQEIIITGLQDSDYRISVKELKKLPAVTKKAQATRANGESIKIKGTGPLLENILQQEGKSVKDYSSIRFTALDGYSISLPPDVFKNRSIILAYQINGKDLDLENQPIRVVIPGERAMYWVRMLHKIDLETGAEQSPVKKVVFLETAAKNLPQEDYEHFDSVDKAIKTKDLVDNYAGTDRVKNVFIKASDGLHKNETPSNFITAYIKISGKESPKFLAPNLPQGMHVRDVLCINYGETCFWSYFQGIRVLPPQRSDGKSAMDLSGLIKQTGLSRASKYQFNSLDGSSLELTANEMGKGLIYESQGVLAFSCPGSVDKNLEDLLSIECRE
ncbi:molybdopterin-dependent oxidoreductase [Syntrophomonas wolfei]|uniref:Oxidoreductase molybdopterin-binding domain-containing protein n=1 Tax=Syntrophomonas wolfei subsp. wolfei (strain DSM 2245B / Goettingen) TaxID=335541 RepID=Q0AVG9_SYNWW|nr:molybdopterin-dependent oxidoreductase [Syntrophomonas wolfei]ABI69285.1 hypothetical protein Swol_1990 [Syntrophomonas wolfei subsp. wolfei str. Goettingen G311]